MPKRSRSGVVSRPVRVVAPTRVKRGRSSVSVRAAGPWPTMMSSRKSSSAGYRISSTARLSRWISSTKRTSCSSRLVRIAAMSPLRSSAGPATQRMPTPSSSRTMCARLVFPRPGGPTSRTWSRASSRAFAAVRAIASWSLMRSCPTNSARRRGRSDCSSSSSSGAPAGARNWVLISCCFQRLTDAFLRRQLRVDGGESLLCLPHGVAELDERVARDEMRLRARRRRDRHRRIAELFLQLEHDALGRLPADAGNRLEAGGVLEHDRSAKLGRRRTGHDRERDLRPDAVDRQQLNEQLALAGLREAVKLQCVLPHVEVRVQRDLLGAVGEPYRGGRGSEEVADAPDVDDEPLRRVRHGASAKARDHPATLSSGGARAWQMATASASEACDGLGTASSDRMAFTIFCTCCFSARP